MVSVPIPMSPKLKEFENINDANFTYQIKWDGVRILASVQNGQVTLINKNHRDKSLQFPELQTLSSLGKDFIVDGEVMVIEGIKNSFSKILRRNMTIDRKKISHYTKEIPITYGVFDILYLNGRWLLEETLEKRQSILNNLLHSDSLIHICQNYTNAIDLFKTTREMGLEGIIAKKIGSKYTPGKKTYDWIKYKHKQSIETSVGGLLIENQSIRSLAVGVIEENGLRYVGNVGTGLSEEAKEEILRIAIKSVRVESPFRNFDDKNHIWIEPTVKCYIEFMEWTDEYTLRSPVYKGILSTGGK